MDDRTRRMERAVMAGDTSASDALYRAYAREGKGWGIWELSRWEAALAWTRDARWVKSPMGGYMAIPGRTTRYRTLTQCRDCGYEPQSGHHEGCKNPNYFTWEARPYPEGAAQPLGIHYTAVEYMHGPSERNIRKMREHAFSIWGFQGKRWGDAEGEFILDGVRFVLLPSNKGAHRFKIECPKCSKLFGPSKFRQHITRKDHQ